MGMHSPMDRTSVLMALFSLLSDPHLFVHQRPALALLARQILVTCKEATLTVLKYSIPYWSYKIFIPVF